MKIYGSGSKLAFLGRIRMPVMPGIYSGISVYNWFYTALFTVETKKERKIENMGNEHRNAASEEDSGRISLLYTLHTVSRLSREEFMVLKKLRNNKSRTDVLNKSEIDILPGILDGFNAQSIQEVVDIMERLHLFELCDF